MTQVHDGHAGAGAARLNGSALSAELLDDPQLMSVGPVGFAIHVAALMWSESSGRRFIPDHKAKHLLPTTWVEAGDDRDVIWELNSGSGYAGRDDSETIEGAISALVAAELWDEGVDQWGNHGFWIGGAE